MPIVKLGVNEFIKIFGPASINVKTGEIDVYRKRFRNRDSFIIHKLRSCVIQSLSESELEINLGNEASIAQLDEKDPYPNWVKSLPEILGLNPRCVVVVGGVDCGKSTFSIMLANEALSRGLKPAVIDSDVGQADIGPPCFVTMSYPDNQVIWMREYRAVYHRFIGDNKPQYKTDEIICATKDLINKAFSEARDIVVVDTDGWIGDENAVSYKQKLVANVKPDVLVVIGSDLYNVFSKFEKIGVKVVALEPPQNRRTRSREERRLLRRDKYREYLSEEKVVKRSFNELVVLNNPVLNGVFVEEPSQSIGKILFLSKTYGKLHVVSKTSLSSEEIELLKSKYSVNHVRTYSEDYFNNLLVSLSDGDNDYPALLVKIDFKNREFVLKTKYNIDFKLLKFSDVKLGEDFAEEVLEKRD